MSSKVSALTAASALDGTESLHVVQGGADRKATLAQVSAYAVGDQREIVTVGNPSSPYAPAVVKNAVVKVTGLDHDLQLDKPTGTFAASTRIEVDYEITATGGIRTISFGTGISLGFGVAPNLLVASGDTLLLKLYSDDNGSTFKYDGDARFASYPTATFDPATDIILFADADDGYEIKQGLLSDMVRAEAWTIPLGDETTDLTTGTAKVTLRMPFAATLTAVRASLATASSSGTPTFDVNEAGTSVLGTKLTIDASEKTSVTAASAATITDSALADDAEMTIDVDVAGTGARGAKVTLYLRRTS